MKKRIEFVYICFSAFICVLVSNNSELIAAEQNRNPNYIQGQIGSFQPSNNLDNQNFDTDFYGGISYGRYLNENLKIEGAVEGYSTERDFSCYISNSGYYKQEDFLGVTVLLVTLKGEVPLGLVDIYAGAGVGLYGVAIYSDIYSERYGYIDTDDYDAVVGVHASVGMNFNITEWIYLGVEGKYHWTDEVHLKETAASIPIQYKGNLNGYTVGLNIGLRF